MKQVKLYTLKEDIVMSFKDEIDIVTNMSTNTFNPHTYRYVESREAIIQTPKLTTDHLSIKEFVKHTKDGSEVCYIAIHPDIENLLGVTELKMTVLDKSKQIDNLKKTLNKQNDSEQDLQLKLDKLTTSFDDMYDISKELEFENTEIKQVLSKLKFLNFWQRVIFLFTNKLPKVD